MLDKLLDIIYPPVCGGCGKINKNSICNKCKIKLESQAAFGIDNYEQETNKYFDEHLYIFMYSGIIRNILLNYKFNDESYIYKTLTNFLIKNEKIVENIKRYDIIMPVPLSKNRKKERGYNQSELIARELCSIANIKLDNKTLKKQKNTTAQSTLNKENREKNIEGAYTIKRCDHLEGKKVLIIDDIFTTGSTVNECSKLIKKAGTKKIGILTIAKD